MTKDRLINQGMLCCKWVYYNNLQFLFLLLLSTV